MIFFTLWHCNKFIKNNQNKLLNLIFNQNNSREWNWIEFVFSITKTVLKSTVFTDL